MFDNKRYSRQTILPEIGEVGQARLRSSRVLCVGAGGLGSPALLYLAAAGVGKIGIIDPDSVDESNLHRQILYCQEDIGGSKASIAAEKISALNRTVEVISWQEKLNSINASDIFAGFDLVIDGTDNFTSKYLINDCAIKLNLPVVYGSISQFEGRVSIFWAKFGPCYRCIYPTPPPMGVANCAESGVIGALAGIIGSIQALEAIKLIATPISEIKDGVRADFSLLIGRMMILDSARMRTSFFEIPKNSSCFCSLGNKVEITQVEELCSLPEKSAVKEISFAELSHLGEFHWVDIREADEYGEGGIPRSIQIPFSKLISGKNPNLTSSDRYILFCKSGIRSRIAVRILKKWGVLGVFSLMGGFESWKKKQENRILAQSPIST